MTKTILFNVIDNLNDTRFKVICCVSDCGGGRLGLWKELEITYENAIFSMPNGHSIVHTVTLLMTKKTIAK